MTGDELLKVLGGRALSIEEINMVQLALICEKLGITSEETFKGIAAYAQTRKMTDLLSLFLRELREDEGYNA